MKNRSKLNIKILFFKELTFIIADWMAAKQKICIVLK